MGHGEVFLRDILAPVRKGLTPFSRVKMDRKIDLLCITQRTLQ